MANTEFVVRHGLHMDNIITANALTTVIHNLPFLVDNSSISVVNQTLPTVSPALYINLTDNGLDDRVRFERSSYAYYRDTHGFLKIARANTPRFNYDFNGNPNGLIIESESTNDLANSEYFDVTTSGWVYGRLTETATTTTAPDGSSANLFLETAVTGTHAIRTGTVSEYASNVYTASIFVKPYNRTALAIWVSDSTDENMNFNALFNLSTETIYQVADDAGFRVFDSRIVPYSNGWYRISVSGSIQDSATGVRVWYKIANNNFATTYTGDSNYGLYMWGAQLENQPVSTSYIKTSNGPASRSAEIVTLEQPFNEGTIVIDADMDANVVIPQNVFSMTANNSPLSANKYLIYINNGSIITMRTTDGITTSMSKSLDSGRISLGIRNQRGNTALFVDGALVSMNTSSKIPSTRYVQIGGDAAVRVRSIKFYSKPLSNTNIQALTSI